MKCEIIAERKTETQMSSREIVLWLDERWYDALERHIKGETLREKLDNYLDELCNNLLPDYEYEQISKEIYEERKAQDEMREADRRFAVFKVTEHNEQSLFLVDEPLDFLLAAKALRRYLRGANAATDFRHYYAAAQEITAGEFTRYANERRENTGRVCGMFEIDFDRGQMAGLKIDDGWVWFRLKDVSAAAYRAERKRGLTIEDRWERFLTALDGKAIRPDVSLHGTRSLCAEDVSFSGEINEGDLRLNFYMDAFGGVDEVLGTHVCTTENGDYVNIYAEYDLLGGVVCDKLFVTLCRGNGMDDDYEYALSPKEKEMLLGKMDAYCLQECGKALAEYREEILAEEQEAAMEAPLM